MGSTSLQTTLSSNRAEELGYDVWERFVIPPRFASVSPGGTYKPIVVYGGRGCGKTMLLRYLSHHSAFSLRRDSFPEDVLRHVGIYWRADTQFASLLNGRGKEEDLWRAAFGHMCAIVLSLEVLRSLLSIARSSFPTLSETNLQELDLDQLKAYSQAIPAKHKDAIPYFEHLLAQFEMWANDVRSVEQPQFLPGYHFVRQVVLQVKEQLPQMSEAVFFVYIDEYENLGSSQQQLINAWLKHSQGPLIFNLAMKRNGFKTRDTVVTGEPLAETHDYRAVDIEDFDLHKEFPSFAAEILLSRLHLDDVQIDGVELVKFSIDNLRNADMLAKRCSSSYRSEVRAAAEKLFPTKTRRCLANEIFNDSQLLRRLRTLVQRRLEARKYKSHLGDDFVRPEFPEASIVTPALLSRPRISVEHIQEELRRLERGEPNRFDSGKGWIHNNFVACVLDVYSGSSDACPIYGGFDVYCMMARGNLRHFLELCYQATLQTKDGQSVSVEQQAEAARQAAAKLLPEVRSFGIRGNQLHMFLLRLGSLFSLSQNRPSQSEGERTHFSIRGGEESLGEDERELLAEAVKWSVLFEAKETKVKEAGKPKGVDYIINPIYAPYFHVSYRKGRKLDIDAKHLSTIIGGNYEEFRRLHNEYGKLWKVGENIGMPLFPDDLFDIND